MSQLRKENITCPHCHQEGEFNFWSSVNVDLNPELREKIFSDELFMYHCPHCGEVTGIPAGFLYHDMKHKFMLFFDFYKPDDYDYEPMELSEGDFAINGNYTFRGVFGLNRLKEKILILENELDDVAIERQKYMITHVINPDLAKKGYELYFDHVEKPTDEFPYGTIYFLYDDTERESMMQVRFAMDNYYEHKMACKMDPRMTVKGVQCIDEGWISKQLKEE